jgi:hypothetical protein
MPTALPSSAFGSALGSQATVTRSASPFESSPKPETSVSARSTIRRSQASRMSPLATGGGVDHVGAADPLAMIWLKIEDYLEREGRETKIA